MHGLRCTPALLGWTRLLDEWVVGLTRYNVPEGSSDLCWRHFDTTVETLAHAATRVRSFAGREADVAPTIATSEGTMEFELQGVDYGVAATQHWPGAPEELAAQGEAWLSEAVERAKSMHAATVARVGVVFVTPRLEAPARANRFEIADGFVSKSRVAGSHGCGFSFPGSDERAQYHYVNEEFPGAILLVGTAG